VDAAAGQPEAPAKKGRRNAILAVVLLGLLGGGGYYGYHWWTEGRFLVSTDDAYVKADMSVIASKVGGYIADVEITDNQHVKTGDLLAKIDDRDYRIAVEAAQNKLATQDASIARLKEQAKAQGALIEQAKAQVASAEAGEIRAQADFDRAQALANREYGSKQTLDQARAQRDQAVAGVAAAKAAQLSAEANLSVLNAQVDEATHVRAELQTSLDQANLNLSYTEVRAPFDGVVGNKAVQLGQFVQTGTRLLSLVPLDTVYVEANYKETQLGEIRPGQTADVSVDAADGRSFTGVVESIAPASGSQFSLLPPENATGNFTKIVQRVPVRIRVSGEAVEAGVLRPGLSVVTYVHTKPDEQPSRAQTAQAAPAN
jgi:membrane fusion protein (multidrug efflux system)